VSAPQLNTATRLAMLGERIARLHAQIGRDVLAARARRALAESSAEFEKGLRSLAAIAHPEIRDNYRLLRHLWDEYRDAAHQASTPASARKLADRNEEVVWIANKGARLLQLHAPSPADDVVLAAGRARSAAQRLAKLHVQRGWAVDAQAASREMKGAEAELQLGLARLKSAELAGDESVPALEMADSQFALMRNAIERRHLEHIVKTADHIAESLDRVAKLNE
jgi:hypothetical protein